MTETETIEVGEGDPSEGAPRNRLRLAEKQSQRLKLTS